MPLIVTHGWSGSIVEQLRIIDPLTSPAAHGGTASDAFHLLFVSEVRTGFRSLRYVEADPAPVWQAAGATGGFVASLGAVGYATRRDLSWWYRVLFLGAARSDPVRARNRLRRSGQEEAVPIAASIFLDVLNVILFFLQLFGGNND